MATAITVVTHSLFFRPEWVFSAASAEAGKLLFDSHGWTVMSHRFFGTVLDITSSIPNDFLKRATSVRTSVEPFEPVISSYRHPQGLDSELGNKPQSERQIVSFMGHVASVNQSSSELAW